MKTKLLTVVYGVTILFALSCKSRIEKSEKVKKIAVRSFTAKDDHDEATIWYYIKNVTERGVSGYYLENNTQQNDFREAHFMYSKTRPLKFEEEAASGEKVELVSPKQLPNELMEHVAELESIYE